MNWKHIKISEQIAIVLIDLEYLVRIATLKFSFHSCYGDVSLTAASIDGYDDVLFETEINHLLLIGAKLERILIFNGNCRLHEEQQKVVTSDI